MKNTRAAEQAVLPPSRLFIPEHADALREPCDFGQLVAAWAERGAALPVAIVVSVFDDLLEHASEIGSRDVRPPREEMSDHLRLDDIVLDRSGVARLRARAPDLVHELSRLLEVALAGGAGETAIPAAAQPLLRHALSEDPSERPSDPEQLRSSLRNALGAPAGREEVLAVIEAVSSPPLAIPSAVPSDTPDRHDVATPRVTNLDDGRVPSGPIHVVPARLPVEIPGLRGEEKPMRAVSHVATRRPEAAESSSAPRPERAEPPAGAEPAARAELASEAPLPRRRSSASRVSAVDGVASEKQMLHGASSVPGTFTAAHEARVAEALVAEARVADAAKIDPAARHVGEPAARRVSEPASRRASEPAVRRASEPSGSASEPAARRTSEPAARRASAPPTRRDEPRDAKPVVGVEPRREADLREAEPLKADARHAEPPPRGTEADATPPRDAVSAADSNGQRVRVRPASEPSEPPPLLPRPVVRHAPKKSRPVSLPAAPPARLGGHKPPTDGWGGIEVPSDRRFGAAIAFLILVAGAILAWFVR